MNDNELRQLPQFELRERLAAATGEELEALQAEEARRGRPSAEARRSQQRNAADRGDAAARRGRLNDR